MASHNTPLRLLPLLCIAVCIASTFGTGCAKDPGELPSRGLTVPAPNQSVFLRASFDDDPSSFIGRFLPDSLEPGDIDENRSATTRCSEYITYKEVKASGTYDEMFNSSTSVGATLGFLPLGNASAGAGEARSLRVKYKLRKKMRAEISNPAALDQCCKAAPDQCANNIIGEFFYGSGFVYQAAGSQAQFAAAGKTPQGVDGDLDFKDEIAWKRMTEFEDVYFAFRTQATRLGNSLASSDASDCSWANTVPSSLDGQYFIGVSDPSRSEKEARDQAMLNARAQAIRYLGEYITSSVSSKSSTLDDVLDNQQAVTSAAQGVARFIKDEKWCSPPRIATPKGSMHVAKVLAFFPKSAQPEAAKQAITNMKDSLKAQGKLTRKQEKTLIDLTNSLDRTNSPKPSGRTF